MFQVAYSREEGTNLYRVKAPHLGQTLVASRNFLVKNIGIDPRVIVGCKEVSFEALSDLGFVVDREQMKVAN